VLNLREEFVSYFCSDYEDHELYLIATMLQEKADKFIRIGLPSPIYQTTEDSAVFLSWFHQKYMEYSEVLPPNDNFLEILDWISKCDGNEFLLACSAYFSAIDCDKIYITDQPHDGGIDLIASNLKIPKIPIYFFAQAKTGTNHHMSKEVFQQELGKYRSLKQKEQFIKYLSTVSHNLNGYALSYVFLTNQEILENTIREANLSEAILLSRLQLAYTISLRYSKQQIDRVGCEVKKSSNSNLFKADLRLNIATKFKRLCSY
jgi:hypothetical protein